MRSSTELPRLSNSGPLGVMRRFLANPLIFFEEPHKIDAPFVKFRLAHKSYYYVNRYEVLEELLKKWKDFQKGSSKLAREVLGTGLVFAEEADWTKQRRIMAPAFYQKAIESYQEMMHKQLSKSLDQWQAEQENQGMVNMTDGFYKFAIRSLQDALFGTHNDEDELQTVLDGINSLFQHLIAGQSNPLLPPLWIPTGRNRKSKHHIKSIREIILRTIREREQASDGQTTLIDMMIHGREESSGTGLSDDNVIDQVKIFFVAGSETSSNTMTFACWLLAQYPAVYRRLQEEIDQELGQENLHLKDIGRLPYLRAVVNETLRMYPPNWINTRTTKGKADAGGVQFQSGTDFMFSPYQLHRSEACCEQANKFLPERWLQSDSIPRYFFPFSLGPRKCIGDQFALAEIYIALSGLIQRCDWTLLEGYEGQEQPGATLYLSPKLMLHLQAR
ncbi:MAG: cytochrome P450 [Bacteroidota bacterium]